MIGIDQTVIRKLIVHRIGEDEDTSILSADVAEYANEDEEAVLRKVFLKPFLNQSETFEFAHDIDVDYNVLYKLSKAILDEEDFIEKSKDISQHLLSSSKHPNIKDGDLFVVKFDDILLNKQYYRGLGIYKFEDKDSFIETTLNDGAVNLKFQKGIGGKKPDKACLIIFTEDPYTLLIIENNNADTDYWQNEFIKHQPKKDHVNNTNDFLNLTKKYIVEQIPSEYEISKTDQIDFLNRSVDYFKKHETFDKKEFSQEVFHDNDVIESFSKFDESYRSERSIETPDSFEISPQAVKKQARAFKSILKLDKNFHIYIHGNTKLIEQGVENDGRKFYKIYYTDEA